MSENLLHNSDFEINKQYWDARVDLHMRSEFYAMEKFRRGGTSLNPTELEELGPVDGKKLCHLQCHFGQDTLSWARLGAHVTGLDLSGEAISKATGLAEELGIEARFVEGNVLEASSLLGDQYDIVFTSYGTVLWLHDLSKWASQVAKLLKPGGVFYLADFHPVAWMFDEQLEKIKYSYFNDERIVEETSGSYAEPTADLKMNCITWNHSLSEICNALINAGLKIEFLHEFGYCWYPVFGNLVSRPPAAGGFHHKDLDEKIPLMYSLKARL
ncbi:MAG: class I SAM-dependent methyltransferase [Bacteroidetes bacterium]|nr:class I SAM-dependent methyltransferase [Bacteroidota bacterium]